MLFGESIYITGRLGIKASPGTPEARANRAWEAPVDAPSGRPAWDVVLVDPPRSGLHPRALEKIAALAAPRIIYVSCNPSTLARDAGFLVADAGYSAKRLRVFNLFPQTPHLESVLLLERGLPT